MEIFADFTTSVLKLNKLVQKIKAYEIEKFGLKPIHVMCSYYLYKHPRGLTAKALGELALEDKAAISRALKTMQEKGYVTYGAEGRNALVSLTAEGKALAAHVTERADKAVSAGSLDFTEKERIAFYQSLNAVVENLKLYYKELIKNDD